MSETPPPPPPDSPPPPPPPPAGYGSYPTPPPMPQTSSDAVVALVLALLSWVICPVIPAIVALVFASKARREIDASNGWITGDGMVTASKIIAWINIVFAALGIVFFLVALLFGLFGAASTDVPLDTPNDFNNAVMLLGL